MTFPITAGIIWWNFTRIIFVQVGCVMGLKKQKNFLSKITRPRFVLFGIKCRLEVLNQYYLYFDCGLRLTSHGGDDCLRIPNLSIHRRRKFICVKNDPRNSTLLQVYNLHLIQNAVLVLALKHLDHTNILEQ